MQPAASAGATLQAIWLIGQFHGVIMPTTPIGSRRMAWSPSPLELVVLQDLDALARWPMPIAACAFCDSDSGAPISIEIASTMSP